MNPLKENWIISVFHFETRVIIRVDVVSVADRIIIYKTRLKYALQLVANLSALVVSLSTHKYFEPSNPRQTLFCIVV